MIEPENTRQPEAVKNAAAKKRHGLGHASDLIKSVTDYLLKRFRVSSYSAV